MTGNGGQRLERGLNASVVLPLAKQLGNAITRNNDVRGTVTALPRWIERTGQADNATKLGLRSRDGLRYFENSFCAYKFGPYIAPTICYLPALPGIARLQEERRLPHT